LSACRGDDNVAPNARLGAPGASVGGRDREDQEASVNAQEVRNGARVEAHA